MAHSSSPHSPIASPPRYEKSSINQQRNNCLRYDQQNRDPAPRYSSKSSYRAEADLNGLLGTSADDKLPPYAPTLQLLTLCRRKNELDAKDRKAKKRSWDLVWLLLDGTALRMYQPTTAETKKFQIEWNEKYCRKGPTKKVVAHPVEREEDEEVEETDGEQEAEEVLDVHSTMIEETRTMARPSHGRGRSSSTAKTPFESTPTPSTSTSRPAPTRTRTRVIMPSPTSPLARSPTSASFLTPPTRPTLNIPPHPSLPTILSRKPSISHAVRNISCTRATTYFKRHFVLRFVLEDGRQFLVQLNSHEETLVWQQVVAIATPLALDIDERDMPEPAPYPRPRRHTNVPTTTTTPASPTLVRRPSTAPAVIDASRIPNVPPEYETSPPHADGGMRRRRSSNGL